MERSSGRQRVVLHASSSSRSPERSARQRHRQPNGQAPQWFDLPLLLPEADAVMAKIQRNYLEMAEAPREEDAPAEPFTVPKASRLSPEKDANALRRRSKAELDKHARLQQYMSTQRHVKRRTTVGGAPVVLDRLQAQRSRWRDRLWRDLDRYGFQHLGDATMAATVDESVRAIMTQLGETPSQQDTDVDVSGTMPEHRASFKRSTVVEKRRTKKTREKEEEEEEEEKPTHDASPSAAAAVFLTALPSEAPLSSTAESTAPLHSTITRVHYQEAEAHEDDLQHPQAEEDEEEENGMDHEEGASESSVAREISAPGLRRRKRLKELHAFVETQLQKRLFRSWETIEIALGGSGDLTVQQIVKFLQHSDVKLSAADAAKVHAILQRHVEERDAAARAAAHAAVSAMTPTGEDHDDDHDIDEAAAAAHVSPPGKLSYDAFRALFHPVDPQTAARWRRDAEKDKARLRQEKEIYDRELAALEERVQRRLAEAARHMVEVLQQFRCDPLALPWESDAQRLALRQELLQIIFRRPARRRLLLAQANASEESPSPSPSTENAAEAAVVPERLSVPQVRSALLQKFARNGHLDSVEVGAAAYVFHDLAIDVVKQSIRALWARRATDLWPERQLIFQFRLRKSVFLAWRRFTRHAETLRTHVLRKFVAWAWHTRQRVAYYAFFRACFWPFYTWKRELQRMILARGKAKFLRRLVDTYVQLRHLRAWTTRLRRKLWRRRQVERARRQRARRVLRVVWAAWLARYRLGLQVHRLWRSHGHVLQRLHRLYMVRVTFVLWRYLSILRRDLAARSTSCLHAFVAVSSVKRPRPTQQTNTNVPRGATWLVTKPASHPTTTTGAAAAVVSRSASAAVPRATAATNDVLGDDDVDAYVVEELDDAGHQQHHQTPSNNSIPALSRIMETSLAARIKRKSRLYDLCLELYLQFRERDRRQLIGNEIRYRRVGRVLLRALRATVERGKKQRFATELGAFRVLRQRFRWWLAVSVYKHPFRRSSSSMVSLDVHGLPLKARATAATTPASEADQQQQREQDDEDGDEKEKENRAQNEQIRLEWRLDTEWRRRGLENVPVQAARLEQDLLRIAADDVARMERIEDLERQLHERRRQEESFLRKEAGGTMKIRAAQAQQAQQILRKRGQVLHDALDRVFDALLAEQRRRRLRSSFRSLRAVLMERLTTPLCHRAQLRNWLRLCRRFAFWDRNAARFYALKLKFHVFRTLLRFVVFKWRHETPGLSAALQRRQQLLWRLERYLERRQLLAGTPSASRLALTRHSPANSFHGVFLRWVQFTQFERTHREMVACARRQRELWRMHSVFQTLKTFLKAKYTFPARRARVPFLWRQCAADLDAMHCKIVALRATLPSHRLRRQLRLSQHALQQLATGEPTLKQRFQLHEREVRSRLFLENRLMFVAFQERRVHNYAERSSVLQGTPLGRAFAYEKAPPYGSVSEVIVLCGKKVDGIALQLKTNAAVTVETQLHGNPFANREVFPLARGERLVAIEGFASQTIFGLRFGTSTGRWSKWFGHCDKGSRFELRSDWSGRREEIVGVFGYADATTLYALGCVFRHTTLRNIFEGMWLQGATSSTTAAAIGGGGGLLSPGGGASSTQQPQQLSHVNSNSSSSDAHDSAQGGGDDMSLCNRQFAYFLQVRTCDVLLAMRRAHQFALRMHRTASLPPVLTRPRVLMALMRWFFNALTHGLVHNTTREDEGKRILQDGMNKRALGERLVDEGRRMLAEVDNFRGEDRQLSVAALGTKKVNELKEMLEQGEAKVAHGQRLIEDGQALILEGRTILPHIPMTRRMVKAIRRMYKVVQTKDYIDQIDPELRAILLAGDSASKDTPSSIYDQV
ncbi:hypothetical protein PINS_up011193 [Pythium insidiosum]|nr:hypothetical protein PINS_up011193 [Pythium insidiosum]